MLYCQHICQLCSFQLYKIKFYIYTVSKKHVTTFSKISWTRTVCLQWLLSDLLHVFLVSHLTYLVQLLYHGKLSRPKYLVSKNMWYIFENKLNENCLTIRLFISEWDERCDWLQTTAEHDVVGDCGELSCLAIHATAFMHHTPFTDRDFLIRITSFCEIFMILSNFYWHLGRGSFPR